MVKKSDVENWGNVWSAIDTFRDQVLAYVCADGGSNKEF